MTMVGAVNLIITCFVLFMSVVCLAQKKARVLEPQTPVYSEASFDAEVIIYLDPKQKFIISNKTFGPFYKIKLPNGQLGFVPDTDLYIEGVGAFQAKNFVEEIDSLSEKEFENLNPSENNEKKINSKNTKNKKKSANLESEDEAELIKAEYAGVSLQTINFQENTLGATQVSDLPALGYKYQPMSTEFGSALAYEVFFAPSAPKYYSNKTGGSASGGVLWGSAQISNTLGLRPRLSFRYGAGPFTRLSYFEVKTSQRTYVLQDLTVGLDFQLGLMLHFKALTIDLGMKYFFDQKSYGAFGVTLLF